MEDEQLEGFLRDALLAANHPDTLGFPAPASLSQQVPFSARYQRWARAFLADPVAQARRKARPLWQKVLQTAACLVLAGSLSVGALLAVSPSVRAEFMQWCKEITQLSDTYRFTGAQTGQILGNWRPTFVPEGYEEAEVMGVDKTIVRYQNDSQKTLTFMYSPLQSGSMFNIDNDDMDILEITIGNYSAQVYQSRSPDKPNQLIWFYDEINMALRIISFEPTNVLVSMAESVSLVD